MLYPKNAQNSLSPALFQNPTAEYRATPFWAWNCKLTQDILNRQIDCMQQMGFGGFHMHVRVGMETTYLSDPFMDLIRGCVEKARENEMLAWLYDEDKWPSGFAGGYVTKNKDFRMKSLCFTRTYYDDQTSEDNSKLLAKYAVTLHPQDGTLVSYHRLSADAEAAGLIYYAYLVTEKPRAWYNLQTYLDTLSKPAVEEFVRITHERYLECVGDEFGKLIPAIFTDEPQSANKHQLSHSFSDEDVQVPFTADLDESYFTVFGEHILDKLPELFWELPQGVSQTRYRFHDHVAERFASAFADTIGDWCGKHNIMLTGHMMEEPTLHSQTRALGDTMRSYRSFQLPGIDMLCDHRELNTAKQAQSAAHQYGRPGVLSELYGVTNWNFDFRHHKMQGDWQAALGVSVRVPHLYWVSMRGEAKRDYPASIGHQSPWYAEYKYLEDHFARVNAAMTRGRPIVRIAVIHPVESYWLHWGPSKETAQVREDLDMHFHELTNWLLYNTLDFDFVCESLLPAQFDKDAPGFTVGEMQYDVVLVPGCETLRGSTMDALEQFHRRGGKIIFAGKAPQYVDALPSVRAFRLADICERLPWSQARILQALEPYRTLSVFDDERQRSENLIYQLRQDAHCQWLFLCNVEFPQAYYSTEAQDYTLTLSGSYRAEKYDTFTGKISPVPTQQVPGETTIQWRSYSQDSILLRLVPEAEPQTTAENADPEPQAFAELAPLVPITLAEPNVLVLDMAEYQLNDSPWRATEEMLRICDGCKDELGLRNDIRDGTQPWVLLEKEIPAHTLRLRYRIQSELEVSSVTLALEDLADATLLWNGEAVAKTANGYYVDEAIVTVPLGKLRKGENILELSRPFGGLTTVENCFLLGDFGVRVTGRFAVVTEPVRSLTFGDWVHQGLPFYGGNVTYHCTVQGLPDRQAQYLEATQFNQPVLGVDADSERKGVIAIAPYRVSLGNLSEGDHSVDITAFGNRINTFGQIHNSHIAERWYGPHAWRSEGYKWTYEYRLWPCGILTAPRLLK